MSFFKGLGKVVSDIKGFAQEIEDSELERKRKALAKLKEANKKKSEKDLLDKEIAEERNKLNKDSGWFS